VKDEGQMFQFVTILMEPLSSLRGSLKGNSGLSFLAHAFSLGEHGVMCR
jgi:hypothetical protein